MRAGTTAFEGWSITLWVGAGRSTAPTSTRLGRLRLACARQGRGKHLEGIIQTMTLGRSRLTSIRREVVEHWILCSDSNIDNHVMGEILVPRNQGGALVVLEDNTPALIQAIEVLDGCDDGVGCVVREDVDPHRQAGSVMGGLWKKQLETDMLGLRRFGGRQRIMRQHGFSARVDVQHGAVHCLRVHVASEAR